MKAALYVRLTNGTSPPKLASDKDKKNLEIKGIHPSDVTDKFTLCHSPIIPTISNQDNKQTNMHIPYLFAPTPTSQHTQTNQNGSEQEEYQRVC